MKPVFFAVLTAVCWSVGGFFEKKGLLLGNLPPVMGITVRTATALLVLGFASLPSWNTLQGIGTAPLLYLVLGGGVLAGALGTLFFYTGIATGELSRVIPVAFGLTPLFGLLLGVLVMKEQASAYKLLGVIFTSIGVVCIASGR